MNIYLLTRQQRRRRGGGREGEDGDGEESPWEAACAERRSCEQT
jgi:hypothetical protein